MKTTSIEKFRLQNCEESSTMEWLETNGLGGYASSSVSGLNTRRYHGVLVASMHPPVERVVVLSKLDETIISSAGTFELSANQYPNTIHPKGYKYLQGFKRGIFPEFSWKAGGVKLTKYVAALHNENTTLIVYKVEKGSAPFTLELLPLASSRDFHGLSRFNEDLNPAYQFSNGIFRTQNYAYGPELFIAIPNSTFQATGQWFYSLEYQIEKDRGQEYEEDLYNHGKFFVNLKAGDTLGIIISTENPEGRDGLALFKQEEKRRKKIIANYASNEKIQSLAIAADQFIVKRGNNLKSIIAGYHWFSDWGRDTMISLPGLCLVTNRYEDARKILMAFAECVSEGMLPNRFSDYDEHPEYNTIDATLWFFHALYKYYQYTGDKELPATLIPILREIIDWHDRGTRYNIRVDSDELLSGGKAGVQLTWMDAKVGDWVVTPRSGKAVEINALWHNALHVMAQFYRLSGDEKPATVYQKRAQHVCESFNTTFWSEEDGYLYDYINESEKNNDLRPNQIYVLSLPFPLLSRDRSVKVFNAVTQALLTPRGLRSLAPKHQNYQPTYSGDLLSRDGAYHEGTVWSFLIGPYVDALMKIKGEHGREEASHIINTLLDHLHEAGIGTISEIFDGDTPHTPRGCIAQAWGVAEVFRVIQEHKLNVSNTIKKRKTTKKFSVV